MVVKIIDRRTRPPDMNGQQKFLFTKRFVERKTFLVGRIKILRQPFHQHRAGFGTALQLGHGILAIGMDRCAKEHPGMPRGQLDHVIVGDVEVRPG